MTTDNVQTLVLPYTTDTISVLPPQSQCIQNISDLSARAVASITKHTFTSLWFHFEPLWPRRGPHPWDQALLHAFLTFSSLAFSCMTLTFLFSLALIMHLGVFIFASSELPSPSPDPLSDSMGLKTEQQGLRVTEANSRSCRTLCQIF